MANAIINSPIPENFSDEQKIEYELGLKNTARSFQEQALTTFQTNIELANKNNIKNVWITLSKSHISMLSGLLDIKNN